MPHTEQIYSKALEFLGEAPGADVPGLLPLCGAAEDVLTATLGAPDERRAAAFISAAAARALCLFDRGGVKSFSAGELSATLAPGGSGWEALYNACLAPLIPPSFAFRGVEG